MTQTKLLITGATGSTGGYTVRQLLEKNQAVRVLAHRSDERSDCSAVCCGHTFALSCAVAA